MQRKKDKLHSSLRFAHVSRALTFTVSSLRTDGRMDGVFFLFVHEVITQTHRDAEQSEQLAI